MISISLVCTLGLAGPFPGGGEERRPEEDAIEEALRRELPHVVALRRRIHAHPELGEEEVATAALVAAELGALGLEVHEGIAVTGVVGLLRGGRPGPLVAYRADMDALPIREETGLPYASTVEALWRGERVGVMHACGHDMHTAIALGMARVLAAPEVRRQLQGSVMLLFQPAEESVPGPGSHGAKRMLEEGVFEERKPAVIFGLHVHPELQVGQLSVHAGAALAAVDRVTIRVEGRQAHGAYPHSGVDPIVAASHIVVALQTIASRNVDTHESVVLSIGRFRAGQRFNIIPERAELVGTLRTHDERIQARVHRRIREIAEAVAASMEARATVEITRTTPVTFNDLALVSRMRPVFASAVGEENLIEEPPHMGGEDFAYFAR